MAWNKRENSGADNQVAAYKESKKTRNTKTTLCWILSVIFALFALTCLTSGGIIAGLLAFAFVGLVLPIAAWQSVVSRFIKGKWKTIVSIGLAVLFFSAVPTTEETSGEKKTPDIVTMESVVEDTGRTLEPTTAEMSSTALETSTLSETETISIETATEPTTTVTTAATEPATKATEPTTTAAEPATKATEPTTQETTAATEPIVQVTGKSGRDYVINKNTKKFHYPSCSSVKDIKAENRWDYFGTRDDIIAMKYEPCGRCHP